MRFSPFVALLYFILSSVSLGLYCCKPTSQEKNEEYSITLIALTSADSATVANKALGLARYIYIDLNNDSVIYFRKTLNYEVNSKHSYTKSQVEGRVKGISKNMILQKFAWDLGKAKDSKLSPDIEEGVLYCGFTFIALLKKGQSVKAFHFTTYGLNGQIEDATHLLLSLSDSKSLHSSTSYISEDSILVPLLSRPELSLLPPGIPPPPRNSPPPPPPVNWK